MIRELLKCNWFRVDVREDSNHDQLNLWLLNYFIDRGIYYESSNKNESDNHSILLFTETRATFIVIGKK